MKKNTVFTATLCLFLAVVSPVSGSEWLDKIWDWVCPVRIWERISPHHEETINRDVVPAEIELAATEFVLADLQEDLIETLEEVEEAQEALVEAQVELAETQDELAVAEDDLVETLEALAEAQEELAEIQDEIALAQDAEEEDLVDSVTESYVPLSIWNQSETQQTIYIAIIGDYDQNIYYMDVDGSIQQSQQGQSLTDYFFDLSQFSAMSCLSGFENGGVIYFYVGEQPAFDENEYADSETMLESSVLAQVAFSQNESGLSLNMPVYLRAPIDNETGISMKFIMDGNQNGIQSSGLIQPVQVSFEMYTPVLMDADPTSLIIELYPRS
ncbi:MAG: hypothetical protein WCF65_01165 [Parachlamydiaceae bacterium]